MTENGTARAPSLGDFTRPGSNPDENNVRTEDAKKRETEEDALLQQQGMGDATEQEEVVRQRISLYQEMQDALLPVKDYKKFLKEQDIPEEKAARIVDDLLTKGYYEESFSISKKRHVVLRTRERRDAIRLEGVTNARMPLLASTVDELTTRYNLAASLAEYNEKRFSFPSPDTESAKVEEMFDERMRAVETLPDPMFYKLTQKLAIFDRMIAAVMREGVAENF